MSIYNTIEINGKCDMIKKVDVRELTMSMILQVLVSNERTFFLIKKDNLKEAKIQNDIMSIYNVGKMQVINSGESYETNFLGESKLLNPVIRVGHMIVKIDFTALTKVDKKNLDYLDVSRELSGSFSSIGPIEEMYIWS